MAAILGLPPGEIGAATSTDTVASWDSIQHVNLILALQETLALQFEPAEINEMLSFPKIMQVIERKQP